MEHVVIFALLILSPNPVAVVNQTVEAYPNTTLTPAQRIEEIQLMRRALEEIHPGYDRYHNAANWDKDWSELEARMGETMGIFEFYREVQLLLTKVRCDHTKAEPPEDMVAYRNNQPTHLPFRFDVIEGRALVSYVHPSAQVLERGDEILSINGKSFSQIIHETAPYIAVDGFTDHIRTTALGSMNDYMGSGFDAYHNLVTGFQHSFDVRWRTAQGNTRTQRFPAVSFKEWRKIPSKKPANQNFVDAVSHKILDDKTAYLNVMTFVNYRRPVDPVTVLQPVFKDINASGAEHLIIDLRDNGGGSTDAMVGLMRFLMDRPFAMCTKIRLKTIDLTAFEDVINTWDKNALKPNPAWFTKLPDNQGYLMNTEVDPISLGTHEPHADAFKGRVTVLTSPANASGSTRCANILKGNNRARLVGGETGGSSEGATAGVIFFLKLPHSGIIVRVPAQQAYAAVERFNPGKGLIPDVAVSQTVADYRAGRDTILEAALQQ